MGLARCIYVVMFVWLVNLYTEVWADDPTSPEITGPSSRTTHSDQEGTPIIYVPYRQLREVWNQHNIPILLGLPLKDYLQWWQEVMSPRLSPLPSLQVRAVLTTSDYRATCSKDLAHIQANLTAINLHEGWSEIPIHLGTAAIGSLTSDPDGAFLVSQESAGAYRLLLPKQGTWHLTFELSQPVENTAQGRQLRLQVPPVPQTTIHLTVTEPDQQIDLSPAFVPLQREKDIPSEGLPEVATAGVENLRMSHLSARFGAVQQITARWIPRLEHRPDMAILLAAESLHHARFADGLFHLHTTYEVDVLRGQIEQLRVALPPSYRVLDVASPQVRILRWDIQPAENHQILTATFAQKAAGKITLEVHNECGYQHDVPVPLVGRWGENIGIHLLDVLRERGYVAITTASDLSLVVATQEAAPRLDANDIPVALRREGAQYFRFYSTDARLSVAVRPLTPRISVTQRAECFLGSDQLLLQSQLHYTIERAGLFTLRCKIPDGWQLVHIECPGMREFLVSDDGRQLEITLKEKANNVLDLTCKLSQPRTETLDKQGIALELLTPEDVVHHEGQLELWADPSWDVVTDRTQTQGFQPTSRDEATHTPPLANIRWISSWHFTHTPARLPLRWLRKPAIQSVQVTHIIDTLPELTKLTSRIKFLVEQAGVDTFVFLFPSALTARSRLELDASSQSAIKQIARADSQDPEWTVWTVTLQSPVIGPISFVLQSLLLPDVNNTTPDGAATYRIDFPRFFAKSSPGIEIPNDLPDISRLEGEVLIQGDKALVMQVLEARGLEPIDIRETSQAASGSSAYRYFQEPVYMRLQVRKPPLQAVVQTQIEKALLEMVFDPQGEAICRMRYAVKTSEKQRLALDLPKNAEPLGVQVEGVSSPLERQPAASSADRDSYWINVARAKSIDETLKIVVTYKLTFSQPPFQQGWQGVRPILVPLLGGPLESVAWQQLRIAVWYPRPYVLSFTPEGFTALNPYEFMPFIQLDPNQNTRHELEAWIDVPARGLIEVPAQGRLFILHRIGGTQEVHLGWWNVTPITWLFSISAVIIGWILRSTRVENKLTAVLLLTFLLCLLCLQDEQRALLLVFSLVPGGMLTAVLWGLHAWFMHPRRRSSPQVFPAVVIPPPGVFTPETPAASTSSS